MRYLTCALLMVLCALLWSACCDPAKVAAREIDRITRTTMTTEASYKRLTKDRLLQIATEEHDRRVKELTEKGCDPKVSAASQPNGFCVGIAVEAEGRYNDRKEKVVVAVKKVDAATGMVYATLLLAVDALLVLKEKVGTLPALQALVVKAAKVLTDLITVYTTFQTSLKQF